MEVRLAKHAGACYGVQRALDLARAVMEREEHASTLGPLIHNPKVVSELEAQGCTVAKDAGDVGGGTVIIRSHGVAPDVRSSLEDAGLSVVDATCPHVSRAQQGAAELASEGCRVLVVGEAGHPEVEGLLACAEALGAKADVVLAPESIPSDLYDPIGVVVQTTQMRENLDSILDELARRGIKPVLKDTICSATAKRQRAAEELAAQVDAMVVIGGRNSSNTTRLAEICRKACPRTFHVESASELRAQDFEGCAVVGVTAGASTPENQISDVVEALAAL